MPSTHGDVTLLLRPPAGNRRQVSARTFTCSRCGWKTQDSGRYRKHVEHYYCQIGICCRYCQTTVKNEAALNSHIRDSPEHTGHPGNVYKPRSLAKSETNNAESCANHPSNAEDKSACKTMVPQCSSSSTSARESEQSHKTSSPKPSEAVPSLKIASGRRKSKKVENTVQIDAISGSLYETDDTGCVTCKPCKKTFTSFQGFRHHYLQAPIHTMQSEIREAVPDISPALTVPAVTPPPPSAPKISSATSTANSIVRCHKCNFIFPHEQSLHGHRSGNPKYHPFYCRVCRQDYPNADDYSAHQALSQSCSATMPASGTRPIAALKSPVADSPACPEWQAQTSTVTIPAVPIASQSGQFRNISSGKRPKSSLAPGVPVCRICELPLMDGSASATFCGHVFCTPCIVAHLKVNEQCPRCCSFINNAMIFPIYV